MFVGDILSTKSKAVLQGKMPHEVGLSMSRRTGDTREIITSGEIKDKVKTALLGIPWI